MNSIQYDFYGKKFCYMGRHSEFTPEIKRRFEQRDKGTAICHRISFYLMSMGLQNALNYFIKNPECLDGNTLAKSSCSYMIGMILAVTGKINGLSDERINMLDHFMGIRDDILDKYKPLMGEMFGVLKFLGEQSITEEQVHWLMLGVEGYVNRILDYLNNEPYNLRLGMASWNASIGSAFDIFENYETEEDQFRLSEGDSKVITLLKHTTLGGGENFDKSYLYIYTAEWQSQTFIYNSRLDIPLSAIEPEESEKPILYFDYIDQKFREFRE
ncbi:MAG: hypothetical protein J6K58_12315 [Lachnospiraceae bacterium]|nr:hypothetical protein [Lachnospiraceae bacterium]